MSARRQALKDRDDFTLGDIAILHDRALTERKAPTEVISRHFWIPKDTARFLIKQAKNAGLIKW